MRPAKDWGAANGALVVFRTGGWSRVGLFQRVHGGWDKDDCGFVLKCLVCVFFWLVGLGSLVVSGLGGISNFDSG